MSKRNNHIKNNRKIVEVEKFEEVSKSEEVNKPSLARGNYVIEIADKNGVIKKIAVANSEINITKLKDGGFTVDL